ncbi:hypothetical protein AAF712_005871 [Marasmius tenuissimus]|uniref:Intradiol ring-cleavage dioxygenases domain-containing protein n=1 Tax=Marasmius tenuissimus TaxID=585030 RepID=A0ABR3A125_9AGAR
MKFNTLLAIVTLSTAVLAHPGPEPHHSPEEFAKRELAARERHIQARACQADIAAFNVRRRAKRALAKRQESSSSGSASSTSTAEAPHYSTLQNTTCIMAPEVTEGPYYINNEMVRQDLREDQSGVTLILDIGVMDVSTCTPMDDVFVEIWAANATGVYGGYPTSLGPPPGESGGGSTDAPTSSMSAPPGGGGGGPMGTTALERNETFLRGGFATGSGGVVELATIYPGFYSGRTAHIHTMVHMNYSTSENGTLISHSGSLLHIGQFFFDEEWNDQVYALSPYTDNTENSRTYNDADGILEQANADGNDAFLALELLGDSIEDGILGYITVGVDSSASYSITNTNYLNSTESSSSADSSTTAFRRSKGAFGLAR